MTQRLSRGVEEPVPSVAEGTPAVLIFPMLLGAFQPPFQSIFLQFVRSRYRLAFEFIVNWWSPGQRIAPK
jgi:hypothetical protein